jgi:hypothetical protein
MTLVVILMMVVSGLTFTHRDADEKKVSGALPLPLRRCERVQPRQAGGTNIERNNGQRYGSRMTVTLPKKLEAFVHRKVRAENFAMPVKPRRFMCWPRVWIG